MYFRPVRSVSEMVSKTDRQSTRNLIKITLVPCSKIDDLAGSPLGVPVEVIRWPIRPHKFCWELKVSPLYVR